MKKTDALQAGLVGAAIGATALLLREKKNRQKITTAAKILSNKIQHHEEKRANQGKN